MVDWKKQFDKLYMNGSLDIDSAGVGVPLKKIKQFIDVTIQEALHDYTYWLMKQGYTDSDPVFEEPLAVDEYLKSIRNADNTNKNKKEN